jgi:hypothetical protein
MHRQRPGRIDAVGYRARRELGDLGKNRSPIVLARSRASNRRDRGEKPELAEKTENHDCPEHLLKDLRQ